MSDTKTNGTALPVGCAKDFAIAHGLSRVVIIGVSDDGITTQTLSWGKTRHDCGMAAMEVQQLRAVIKAQPVALADAVACAARVRPVNVEGFGT
jgi:hypothetical protein